MTDISAIGPKELKCVGPSMPVKSDQLKSAINACQDISVSMNMAEEPSTTATPSNQFDVKCCACSHYVYKRIRSPCVGEQFEMFCEEDNEHDKYAVAVHLKNSLTVVGHIPREITCTCHFFIKNKGEITGEVSRR